MLLTMRVTVAILFSVFVLRAQTPDLLQAAHSAAADPKEGILFSLAFKEEPPPLPKQPFTFKLNLPQSTPEVGGFVFSEQTIPLLETRAVFPQSPPQRPRAVSYSNGYLLRQKIHKYASFASLPLFVSEAIVGQKLFDRTDDESDSLRSVHSALAAGLGVLFGVNSVTGVWNMWEDRKNPNGRGKRLFHSILMLAADAGFVATATLTPGDDDEGEIRRNSDASTHRAVAFSSLGIAAIGYVYMLIAR